MNNNLRIALGFSGGGYRAASFSLGTLSYLNHIKLQKCSLLNCVEVISTVSGGTITGIKYALDTKAGIPFDQFFDSLRKAMTEIDIVNLSLDGLISNEKWKEGKVRSLINAIADVYDEHLFKKARFGTLMDEANPMHLKHMSFNATEFATAKQFRFQQSEKTKVQGAKGNLYGVIGNSSFVIPREVAAHIRMADILAASSCFPGGFEPINFPTDFSLPVMPDATALTDTGIYPVGLMDGGIVDNQGIEPILLADKRMKKNDRVDHPGTDDGHALDLIIIADVVSPYMDDYVASEQAKMNWWRRLSPAMLLALNTILLLGSGYLLYHSISHHILWLTIVSTAVLTLCVVLFFIGRIIKKLPKKAKVPEAFRKPIGKLLKMKLLIYENLIVNRVKSILQLTNDVFLKHIRRLNYDTIYNDVTWKNRRIMNSIYELSKDEKGYSTKLAEGKITQELFPSDAIQKTASKARSMGTTLWFTKDELARVGANRHNMLDTIIACGQFTTCWNLLEYAMNIKMEPSNTNLNHKILLDCEDQLREDWKRFQEDPYWLLK